MYSRESCHRVVKDVLQRTRIKRSLSHKVKLLGVRVTPLLMTHTPTFFVRLELYGYWSRRSDKEAQQGLQFVDEKRSAFLYANIPTLDSGESENGKRIVTLLVKLPPEGGSYRIVWVDGLGAHKQIGQCKRLSHDWWQLECKDTVASIEEDVQVLKAFVGGAPKSGTTWVEKILNAHPFIYCTGEGEFFDYISHDLMASQISRDQRDYNNWVPLGRDPDGETDLMMAATASWFMSAAAVATGVSCVADRSPYNALHYDRILAFFPKAKIVHCVRHPLDVHVSRMYHERNLYKDGKEYLCRLPLSAVQEFDQALNSGDPQLIRRAIASEEAVAWVLSEWIRLNEKAIRLLGLCADAIFVVRYEDLLNTFESVVEKLYRHLGMSVSKGLLRMVKKHTQFKRLAGRRLGEEKSDAFLRKGVSGDYRNYFTKEDATSLLEQLGPAAKTFGYGA